MSNEVVYKVSQISDYIKRMFDAEQTLHSISMYGEVSGVSVSGGNIYFSLKDENALLQCVAFGTKYESIIKNGDQLLVVGTIRFYLKGGKVSVMVMHCQPYGLGVLYQQYLELKAKLEKEGLFSASHKKTIPKLVQRVGVVTSSTGAVIQDIINITTRRNDGVDIVVYPVKVQGVGADEQIAKGIEFFSNYDKVDVVIVARGGGSFEDLMPFNTEIVARATYNCKKPIVSAVGHETDYTIIDYVSDLRAPTPSAATELVVIDRQGEIIKYKSIIERIYSNLSLRIKNDEVTIKRDLKRFVDYFENKLRMNKSNLITNYKLIYNQLNTLIVKYANELVSNEKILKAINPSNILSKGYAMLQIEGKVISSKNSVKVGQLADVKLNDGSISVQIVGKGD